MSNKRIEAVIDLDAIEHNIKVLYNHMPVPRPIMAVIKANGYGHGSVEIAKRLEKNEYVFGYAVATAEEAIQLRKAGISKEILILGYTFKEDYKELVENNVSLTIFDVTSAVLLNEICSQYNMSAKIHIKVDTGMSRIGVQANDLGINTVKEISLYDNLSIEGIFTHFARADELNLSSANLQYKKFSDFVEKLSIENINPKIVHCANSAAILQIPEAQLSIVRAGIVIYGLWPSDEMMSISVDLKPAMYLHSHIVHIKEISEGTAISYGGTFVADKKMRIATIPVGYADGYPRSLSSKGYVLINGKKANILGRVCMDQMMVDVTGIDADVLDEVVLLGKSQGEIITAEDLGSISGRFNYELVCDITQRVPRTYI